MINKEILKRIILEFKPKVAKKRELKIKNTKKIVSLVGLRRVGKTYYFYYLINQLLKKGIEKERILYVNFDDDRLFGFNIKDFDNLIESYYELFPQYKNKIKYFFFDEIQNIENWELFIRRLYDKENAKIYITGSSSKLLSKEIATALRGRTISYTLFPLSFREYLQFKSIKLEKNFEYTDQRFIIKKEFQNYLMFGSFPEIALGEPKEDTLKSYLDLIIYKDLVERYNIRNTLFLKALIKYLSTNIASLFSPRAYFNLISQEIKIKEDTLYNYLSYLTEIFFVFFIPKFSYSLKSQQINPKKVYIIDNGFHYIYSFRFSENKGKLLENLVAIELIRQGKELYYFKNNFECDFIVVEKQKPRLAIQVTYELNKKNREREIKGLINAMKELNIKEGIILTHEQDDEIETEVGKIKVLAVWKWLLKNN